MLVSRDGEDSGGCPCQAPEVTVQSLSRSLCRAASPRGDGAHVSHADGTGRQSGLS